MLSVRLTVRAGDNYTSVTGDRLLNKTSRQKTQVTHQAERAMFSTGIVVTPGDNMPAVTSGTLSSKT